MAKRFKKWDWEKPQLYTMVEIDDDGNRRAVGYAYGEPWVSQALMMDDIRFDTPEAAREWWEKNYGSK